MKKFFAVVMLAAAATACEKRPTMEDVHAAAIKDVESQFGAVLARAAEQPGPVMPGSQMAIDLCVRIQLVAEVHLQAKSPKYDSWRDSQNGYCKLAGLPGY